MPILSYLIFPEPGRKHELQTELSALPNCDLIPSYNKDLLVLVAEFESKEDEAALQARMEAIPSLSGFSLVAGFDEGSPRLNEKL